MEVFLRRCLCLLLVIVAACQSPSGIQTTDTQASSSKATGTGPVQENLPLLTQTPSPGQPYPTQTAPPAATQTNPTQESLPLQTQTPVLPQENPVQTQASTSTAEVPVEQATPQAKGWWKPTPGAPIHWHWQLSDTFTVPRDVLPHVTVYDIDGELTSRETVAKLHALGPDIIVICYFDAGVYESYRSDSARFPKAVIGSPDEGWPDSYWLDIRQTDVLLPILQDRMQHWCKDKGFDAIEPDETEVWSNKSGFPITKAENNAFNQQVAEMAHSFGLSVGLKGNTTEAPDLWPYFDWTLNEQCWEFDECTLLKDSFIEHGKAVLNIEYNVDPDCSQANAWHMNSARRDLDLVGPTNPDYRYTPCVANTVDNWSVGLTSLVSLQQVSHFDFRQQARYP
jgi:hypothetical protein